MTTPAFPAAFPPGRYGRRRSTSRTPRWVVPALVCLVIAATSALAVSAYRRQAGDVQGAVRSYVVTSQSVRLTIEVTKPRNQPASCILRARDAAGDVVGQVKVPVPAAPGRVTATHTVPTHGRAVTGEVLGCTLGNG